VQLDWLETFVAVAERGGFGAAAEKLFRSQSRVSAHIAGLESELGTILFDRSQRPVALTVAGEKLFLRARTILDEVTAARADVVDLAGRVEGKVVLGTYASAGANFVPEVLRAFCISFPHVEVQLAEQAVLGIDNALSDGSVDLAIRPSEPKPTIPGIHHMPLWRERMKVVVAPDHPLVSELSPLPVSALGRYSLIMSGAGTGGEAKQLLSTRGVNFSVAFWSDQPTTVVSLARAGLGVGFVNALALVAPDTEGVRIIDVADEGLVRDVGVYWTDRMYTSRAALAMHSMVINSPMPEGTTAIDGLEPKR
jgi:DNA-binding transcriptional LysR family regulator